MAHLSQRASAFSPYDVRPDMRAYWRMPTDHRGSIKGAQLISDIESFFIEQFLNRFVPGKPFSTFGALSESEPNAGRLTIQQHYTSPSLQRVQAWHARSSISTSEYVRCSSGSLKGFYGRLERGLSFVQGCEGLENILRHFKHARISPDFTIGGGLLAIDIRDRGKQVLGRIPIKRGAKLWRIQDTLSYSAWFKDHAARVRQCIRQHFDCGGYL